MTVSFSTLREPRPQRDTFPNVMPPCSHYGMHRQTTDFNVAVRRSLRALGPIKDTFDALYATGLSGVTVASVVTYLMKKPLLILRTVASDGTTRSHGTLLEGVVEHQAGIRYMILDDFVCNGSTLRRLLNHLPGTGTLAGVCLYTHPRQMSEGELGFAKEFHTDPATAQQKRWRLVRRGRESILFDLILQRGWRNPAALEPTNG